MKHQWNREKMNKTDPVWHQDISDRNLDISRIIPGDRCITVDLIYPQQESGKSQKFYYNILYGKRESKSRKIQKTEGLFDTVTITDLENGVDYEVQITAVEAATSKTMAESPIRLARPGITPGTVVNYIHPDDYTYNFSGRSPASPSIVELPDGQLLVSHDVYWGGGGQNLTKLFRSRDRGNTWQYVTDLFPCFWGKLFMHQGDLYMVAVSTEYGDLLIGRSKDGGHTWTAPTIILQGGNRINGGPHKAPMPVIRYNGRIWTAIDYGSWSRGGHDSGIISADENSDLLKADSWVATPFLKYDQSWPGTISGGQSPGLLEGNVVVDPQGDLVNFLRYHTKGGTPEFGQAIMLGIDKVHPEKSLWFRQVVCFPGNMSKFTIYYDAKSNRYWSLVNRVTTKNVNQRNVLTLISSCDLIHWEVMRDILNYQDNRWLEDDTKVGFQYVDWIFDGDDILAVSRTAINGAYNYHNANYITFHHIKDFRVKKQERKSEGSSNGNK